MTDFERGFRAGIEAADRRISGEIENLPAGISDDQFKNGTKAGFYLALYTIRALAPPAEPGRDEAVRAVVEALLWYASPDAWSRAQIEDAGGDYGRRARAALATAKAHQLPGAGGE